MLLVDDFTRMTVVFFLKNKSEAFENFKIYREMGEMRWIQESNA